MRKLIVSLLAMTFLVLPLQAEMPNLYGGPTFNLNDEEWGTSAASDLVGYWALSLTVALADDGAKGGGLSADLMMVVRAIKLDYKWGDKVRVKPTYLFMRDFDNKVNSHRILLAVIET